MDMVDEAGQQAMEVADKSRTRGIEEVSTTIPNLHEQGESKRCWK